MSAEPAAQGVAVDRGFPLSLDQARAAIAAAIEPLRATETVALVHAIGRVLASDLVSPVDVPDHDNAAMDGYAVRSADLVHAASSRLRVVGRSLAGRPHVGTVSAGCCVRIMTGAVMPPDCDAVVPQEEVDADADGIACRGPVRTGQHRRLAGEDLTRGATVLARGRSLTASDLGLAASVGHGALDVVRRPRVAVFSTGDELRDVDAPLDRGSIRDSNRYTLIGLLQRLGMEVVDLGIVRDDPVALEATLAAACDRGIEADAIVTSGGVSAGDADHTRDVMARMGSVAFWTLAIKPGRPMAFGRVAHRGRSALLFALPGNPVAVMVVFHALVRGALLALAGATDEPLPTLVAVCETSIDKRAGRTEFVRAVASRRVDGAWSIRPTSGQGSGILRSMSEANCLIVLPADRGPVTAGEHVEAWPFRGLL